MRLSDINDKWALIQRCATGCLYEVGSCLCPGAPYEFKGCKARTADQQDSMTLNEPNTEKELAP